MFEKSTNRLEIEAHDYLSMSDRDILLHRAELRRVLEESEVPRQVAKAAQLLGWLEFEMSQRNGTVE